MMQRRSSCRNKSDRAIAKSPDGRENSTEDDEQNEFAEALLLIIVALMIVQGAIYLRTANSC